MCKRVQKMVMEKVDFHKEEEVLDWSDLPDDAAIMIFSRLSCRDQASLSSTCRSLRAVGNFPYFWQALDLRPYNFDAKTASWLASRCKNLQKLRFGCPESACAITNLQARNLRELSVENCLKLSDVTLGWLAAQHEALEYLQINGPASGLCGMINKVSVKAIAFSCPQLKRLWISGARKVEKNAINAFAENCKNLTDIGFVDCGGKVDVAALGNVMSLKFISVAGTTVENWNLRVVQCWSKLPCLIGLDVSRTDIPPGVVSRLFKSSSSLKVLCALDCPELELNDTLVSNDDHDGKVLVSVFTVKRVVASCKDSEISNWLERIISSSLLRVSECDPGCLGNFPLNQGTDLLLGFLRSSANEEVQERAVKALVNFIAYYKNRFAEAVMRSGDGIRLLLNLARSLLEELQSGAAKAIASLLVKDKVAKAVSDEGGISILAKLARSGNRSVAKEALGALLKLECAIDVAVGAKDLVQLTRICHDGVRERAACALRKLCCDDRNREAVVEAGGIEALVAVANSCSYAPRGLKRSAAGVLWELTRSEAYSIAICQEGGVAPLIALANSKETAVNGYAVAALWSLAFYPINALRIIEESGIDTIAHLSSSSSKNPKVTRFFSALALTYMLDQRMDDEIDVMVTYTESVKLERVRKMAMEHVEDFVKTVSDPQLFSAAATSSDPAWFMQLTQYTRFGEASHELTCSEAEIGRFVDMLQNPCPALKTCAAFALLQFTLPSGKHWTDHVRILQNALGAQSALQAAAEDKGAPLDMKIYARLVLRNME